MSLVKKYEEFDKLLQKGDENIIDEKFSDILNEAFGIINKKIEKNEKLDVDDEEERALIRAMFDYMLDLWAERSVDEAKEVGYDMLYLVKNEKLKEMFSMFVIGMLEGLNVDEFFDKYVKEDRIYKDYFLAEFNDEIDDLVIKHKEQFKKEFSKDADG